MSTRGRTSVLLLLLASLWSGLSLPGCGESGDEENVTLTSTGTSEGEARASQRVTRVSRGATREAERADALAPSFERFAARLRGEVGATVGPPGSSRPSRLGSLASGFAWSTIKVPIALTVIERAKGPDRLSPAQHDQIERALTASDNEAAAALFRSLGTTKGAAAAVTRVLREAGDHSTRVSTVGREHFSPYGQTRWPLRAQHTFTAGLAGGCFAGSAARRYVLRLMGRVTSDRWGLGSVAFSARWKGGWGPGLDGRYLVRQMGVLRIGRGKQLVVTIAAVASDGGFASGQKLATSVARWIARRARFLAEAAGRC